MALYAFDGTWKEDYENPDNDTNVVWFRDAYVGEVVYFEGVGTRFGWLGRIFGAVTGLGGRSRVREALRELKRNFGCGDQTIDIVGFSRGAAMALDFANALPLGTKVRFLGLWDTVPSFGVPGNSINLGWNLSLPPGAENCFHAMAMDESRYNFPLHRLEPNPHLTEVWFRGVHSDVGGGNANTGLSSIPLDWMFDSAHRCGLNLRTSKVMENRIRMNPLVAPTRNKLDSKLHRRSPRPGDCIHSSLQEHGGRY